MLTKCARLESKLSLIMQVKVKFRLKMFNLDFYSQFYLPPSPDYSYCRVLYNDCVWSFLFLFQGHRFLGKTHQRNWYETASTGTGYFLPLF